MRSIQEIDQAIRECTDMVTQEDLLDERLEAMKASSAPAKEEAL